MFYLHLFIILCAFVSVFLCDSQMWSLSFCYEKARKMWVVFFFFVSSFCLCDALISIRKSLICLLCKNWLFCISKQWMDGRTDTNSGVFFLSLKLKIFVFLLLDEEKKSWRKNTEYREKTFECKKKETENKKKKTLSKRGKKTKKGFHCRRCHWILVKMLLWAAKFCDSKSNEFTSFSCLYIWKQCNWISKWTWFKLCIDFNACTRMSVCSLHRISLYLQRKREKRAHLAAAWQYGKKDRPQESEMPFEHLMIVTKAKNFP